MRTTKIIFSLIGVLLCSCAQANERFLSFDQYVTVERNGSMLVKEVFVVQAEGDRFRHGMTRAIPLRDRIYGLLHNNHPFVIREILLDGNPVSYFVQHGFAGVVLYIGEHGTFLEPGIYTYTIVYTTDRFIGFFADHDELYWNVVGTEMAFPVDKARAVITLPDGIAARDIKITAFTGFQGSRGQAYTATVDDHSVALQTTEMLLPHEAFTVVVGWPKAFVLAPSLLTKLMQVVGDNIHWLVFVLGFFALLYFSFRTWKRRPRIIKHAIIPLFQPPQGFSPSMCRYLLIWKSDSVGLAADIVGMAVHGLLTITSERTFFKERKFILKKVAKGAMSSELESEENATLFARSDSIDVVRGRYNEAISDSSDKLGRTLSLRCSKFFVRPIRELLIAIAISFVTVAVSFLVSKDVVVLFTALLFVVVIVGMWNLLSTYIQEGQDFFEQVKGFQLFLRTVETDRLAAMTSVDETPALYEKFLPYAIALDAEKEWTRKFAPLFKKMEMQGIVYYPLWFYGGSFANGFDVAHFSSDFSSGFTSAIGSSMNLNTSSTRSSGFSGGSSGGGGGGGGAGGW